MGYTSKIVSIGTHLIDCIRMITKLELKYTYSIFKNKNGKKIHQFQEFYILIMKQLAQFKL